MLIGLEILKYALRGRSRGDNERVPDGLFYRSSQVKSDSDKTIDLSSELESLEKNNKCLK